MTVLERKEREFQQREDQILAAALSLFNRDDWQTVTIDQIAAKAEIGKGTIYKHFASKDEIYARLWMDFFQGMVERIRAVDPSLDVLNRLRAVIATIWEHHRQNSDYQRVVEFCERAECRNRLPEGTRARMDGIEEEMNRLIYATVEEGVESGLFPRKPPEELVFGARAAIIGALRLVWSGCLTGVSDPDRYLELLTDFMLAGMMYQDQVRPSDAIA
jgi:AcrR family transcriptional regulator